MNINCSPCGKTFTGEVCYQQHIQSEKHKKKVKSELPVTAVAELFACNICNISFGTLPNYKKHVESLEHAKNSIKRVAYIDDSEEKIAILAEISDENDSSLEMRDDDKRLINLQECRNPTFYNQSCDICNKIFSGPEPYQQHLASVRHAKKLAQNSSINFIKRDANKENSEENFAISSVRSDENDSNLIEMQDDSDRLINLKECVNQTLYYKSCDLCDKKFSGPDPYHQHLASSGHAKKLAQNSTKVGDLNARSSFTKNPGTTAIVHQGMTQLICQVCDKTFTGPVPYDQHMKSEVHKKKAERMQFFGISRKSNNLNESVSMENAVHSTTDIEESNLNIQQNNGKAEYSYSKIDGKIDTPNGDLENTLLHSSENISDSILPIIENLDSITAEQLGVKFFDVDSEINFDECKQGESFENKMET